MCIRGKFDPVYIEELQGIAAFKRVYLNLRERTHFTSGAGLTFNDELSTKFKFPVPGIVVDTNAVTNHEQRCLHWLPSYQDAVEYNDSGDHLILAVLPDEHYWFHEMSDHDIEYMDGEFNATHANVCLHSDMALVLGCWTCGIGTLQLDVETPTNGRTNILDNASITEGREARIDALSTDNPNYILLPDPRTGTIADPTRRSPWENPWTPDDYARGAGPLQVVGRRQ